MRPFALMLAGLVACGEPPAQAPAPTAPPPEPTAAATTGPSVYELPIGLLDARGRPAGLDVARGHPALVSMFYTSCPAACPMLVAKVQAILAALPPPVAADLRVVLVSLDPVRDTPPALAKVVADHGLDDRWTLLTAPDATTVRKVSALLDFSYRQRADGDFEHASTLVLLDPAGHVLDHLESRDPLDELVQRITADR